MNILKTIGIGIAGVVVGLLLAGAYSGQNLSGIYQTVSGNFPALIVNAGNGTTSVSVNKVCYSVVTTTGTTVYYWYGPTGNVSSSTNSCN